LPAHYIKHRKATAVKALGMSGQWRISCVRSKAKFAERADGEQGPELQAGNRVRKLHYIAFEENAALKNHSQGQTSTAWLSPAPHASNPAEQTRNETARNRRPSEEAEAGKVHDSKVHRPQGPQPSGRKGINARWFRLKVYDRPKPAPTDAKSPRAPIAKRKMRQAERIVFGVPEGSSPAPPERRIL